MTLSNSRQQFLAYESQGHDDIQYGRRGGLFISTCVCVTFILFAVIIAVLVGVITYFITYFKLSNAKPAEFWDEAELFSSSPSPDLRLPSTVVPSFYRLKLITDLENSNFTGEVYITIRASQKVKEIILHSKNLSINDNATLTEQIYEKVETIHRSKRQAENVTAPGTNVTITEITSLNETATPSLNETVTLVPSGNITSPSLSDNGTEHLTTETPTTILVPATSDVISNISLPSVDTEITHSSVRNIKILSITQASGDRVILKLATSLTPNVDYTLQLSFKGHISNALTGFYKSTYTNNKNEEKKLGVTQFEPTSARAAFPCFDEPAFKAKFEISIAHQNNVTVLSNMKVATQEAMPEKKDWQWTHFERSVNMSTYLVAYVLSDFKSLETSYVSQDNVTKAIRIWTRPELIEKANYALRITPKLLKYYEEVFGVPYALEKIDLIAIPDFSNGAMENWGLITFRETTLVVDETDGVPRDRQNVAIDVAHELAHQWFGNLVTMRWWTDLWLNEGFATYIEYVGVDHIEPEWNMLESLSRDKMDLLRSDALKNTSPVSRKVVDASEISQKFDEISYTKGANLIRMLNHTISEELFRKGLVHYLKKWQYTNAEENDLWQAMSTATRELPEFSDLSLVEFMNTWTRQAGYPTVNVRRDYDTGEVVLDQKLFSITKAPYQHMVGQLWQIPISYTTIDAPLANWTTKPRIWLKERSKTFSLPVDNNQALYVNVDAVGYYRVNYDQKNWELLSQAMRSGEVQSPITKAQLIDDAFNLAKADQLNYSYALGLTTCVKDGEDSKIVWDLLLNNMGFLKHNLKATSGYVYFQDYMRMLLKTELGRLNYGLSKPKDDNEAFLMENLLLWECAMEAPRCLDWAKREFDAWAGQANLTENPIPSYLRSLVYNVALKHGTRREFDILWGVFVNSTDPNVKSLIINSLPSTHEEALITTLLEKSLTEIPKQYAIAVWCVESPVGTRLAQNFLLNNLQRVYDKFTEMDAFMFPNVLNGAFGFIDNVNDLNKLKSFAMQHKDMLQPMSQTLQKLVDTATLRIDWIQRHADEINQWFKDYVTGKNQKNETNGTTPPIVRTANTTESSANITERLLDNSSNTMDTIPNNSSNTMGTIPNNSSNTMDTIPNNSSNTMDTIPSNSANITDTIPNTSANSTDSFPISSANITDTPVESTEGKAKEAGLNTTETPTSPN